MNSLTMKLDLFLSGWRSATGEYPKEIVVSDRAFCQLGEEIEQRAICEVGGGVPPQVKRITYRGVEVSVEAK